MLTLGIIREEKQPADKRVVFTPQQCSDITAAHPHIRILVQPSPGRCFADADYAAAGFTVTDDLSSCDILLGIKEVPVEHLLPGKAYMFFSHTIKKQPGNKALMQALISKRITMIDYETLRWQNGDRILGFGRFAGIVGAYNGLLTWGKKYGSYELKPAHLCFDYAELKEELKKVQLPAIKMALTGSGRVSNGSLELLRAAGIREVTVSDYLTKSYQEPVFVQLHSEHLFERIDGKPYDRSDFHHVPQHYRSVFKHYYHITDMLFNGIYWEAGIDRLFEKEDCKKADFKISVIADISCDINGSVPLTVKDTKIYDPVFGWDIAKETVTEPFLKGTIDIMAVSNLPTELPRDASEGFGRMMTDNVLPELLKKHSDIIERATICKEGKLTRLYEYLEDYACTN